MCGAPTSVKPMYSAVEKKATQEKIINADSIFCFADEVSLSASFLSVRATNMSKNQSTLGNEKCQ